MAKYIHLDSALYNKLHPLSLKTSSLFSGLSVNSTSDWSKKKKYFLLGFDLSINNIYEGSKNYPKQVEHPEWKQQLLTVFKEFPFIKFYWVEPQHPLVKGDTLEKLTYITYDTFKHTLTQGD